MGTPMEQALQNILGSLSPWLIVPIGILVLLKVIESALKRKPRSKKGSWRFNNPASERRNMSDPKLQADAVSRTNFVKSPLMNKSEFRVFAILEQTVTQFAHGFRVMAQVNLGEFLRPDASTPKTLRNEAFASINSKRVDFLIIDVSGNAALAVEFQGSGHYLGQTAFLRDALKKEALRRAGVPLLEVTPDMQRDEIIAQMTRLLDTSTDSRR